VKAYRMNAYDVLQEQGTSLEGLAEVESQRRLEAEGFNELKGKDTRMEAVSRNI
jgi:P-type Ca2+ transporter type 2C